MEWYVTAILSVAATLLIVFLVYHSAKAVKNRNNRCAVNSDPEKCDDKNCNKMIKKDLNHLLILFIVVLCFILTNLLHADTVARDYFSFASTIASIILSVVAIIFSITGETRTDALKRSLQDAIDGINRHKMYTDNQERIFQEILQKSSEILEDTKIIKEWNQKVEGKYFNNKEDVNSSMLAFKGTTTINQPNLHSQEICFDQSMSPEEGRPQ